MISASQVATRLLSNPLAIERVRAEILVRAFLRDEAPKAIVGIDMDADAPDAWLPYDVVSGVAVIQIRGMLLQETGMSRAFWGVTGYDTIANALTQALADPHVAGIALDIDSPGGEVAGCFDLVDAIHAARATKPITAILNEAAYSAAYAIASACEVITVPRTGGAGSIGVVSMHLDISAALKAAGLKVTLIQYGANKTDSYPFKPLSDTAVADMQGKVDEIGDLFVETVARNRGVSRASIIDTQARCFSGLAAVEAGLADAVSAPAAAFRDFAAMLAA